ncbi:MAG: glycosyltransferase family 4 protein [Candidatus Dormibacteraeota bacterium]|nr:glycosyltransferase family 4 protein [Candidatus Dormibacteraeota bacterium]
MPAASSCPGRIFIYWSLIIGAVGRAKDRLAPTRPNRQRRWPYIWPVSALSRQLAFVTPQYFHAESYLGGGERYPLNLARGVVKASGGASSVRIVSFGEMSRDIKVDRGVTLSILPAAYAPAHQFNPVSWDLLDVLQDADVIHAHQVFTRTGEATILIASLLGKPVFATDLGAHASVLGRRYGMLELTDGLICISDFAAQLVETAAPVDVIRGGIDTDEFTPPPGPSNREHVLFVGRLLPHKGIDTLLQAAPADMSVVICGSPYDDDYYHHLRSLAHGKKVAFITAADDAQLRDLYRSALATVLPSVYRDYRGGFQRAPELMGLTLLESMACGTPAVCSRVGGMPELIREGETGFIFDSLEHLRGILTALRDGRLSADDVGAQARRTAVAEYDIGVVGARALRLYEAALALR